MCARNEIERKKLFMLLNLYDIPIFKARNLHIQQFFVITWDNWMWAPN